MVFVDSLIICFIRIIICQVIHSSTLWSTLWICFVICTLILSDISSVQLLLSSLLMLPGSGLKNLGIFRSILFLCLLMILVFVCFTCYDLWLIVVCIFVGSIKTCLVDGFFSDMLLVWLTIGLCFCSSIHTCGKRGGTYWSRILLFKKGYNSSWPSRKLDIVIQRKE